ncbi:MAG: hypothetical protein J0M07_32275 [Anaerolineae bacterium]|nr:hypothetical protein [Anaerolineae bacterium]
MMTTYRTYTYAQRENAAFADGTRRRITGANPVDWLLAGGGVGLIWLNLNSGNALLSAGNLVLALLVVRLVLIEIRALLLSRFGQIYTGELTRQAVGWRWRYSYLVLFNYQTELPSGKTFKGWRVVNRLDLLGSRLPGQGTPVKVVYANPFLQRML